MSKSVCEIRHDSHTFTSPMKDFESWKANAMERLKRPNAGRVNGQVLEFNPVRTRSDYARWYAWYRICRIEQEYFVDQNMDAPTLRDCFAHLTNLEKITMNTYNKMYTTDVYDRIGPWDYALDFPSNQIMMPGLRQLNSLLLAVGESQIKLRKLRAGLLSWWWFRNSEFIDNQNLIVRACESLTSLHLLLNCCGEEWRWEETPVCYRYLRRTNAIGVFLAKLPHLESLKLRFDDVNLIPEERRFPARLTYLIPEGHVWPKLRKLELGIFQTSELN
ncbi:hypothetical protein L207DRAFT_292085 [Hyaloscypha variabilis F]|jgi:hypothetical protein|uniref:Uncharacterized protein n=1 Tax=Hyaloscypha variabilis (strain UAMH 11265 / GT02V1 / F) TaxID=1149755 RepID=A0A2J6RXK0_HYAVF|nr:hypothetical protein L207DRAFT_292085 [Hyaloscypha variabilis F]